MNEKPIRLSYLTVSKNKLPYLKIILEKLIANRGPDEEIIVGDGASTDGTPEYLAELKAAGKIDDYISEADYAESHALNKLFLKARGTIIKIINDDDAYHYPTIRACKEFMLAHPEIDVLGMEGGSFKHVTKDHQTLRRVTGYIESYNKWKTAHTPFEFSVLGLMFRRSSLPILGFWNLSFKNADAEYTFRVTAGPAKLAWCLSPAFVFIRTKEGVTLNNIARMKKETARLRKLYLGENPPSLFLATLKKPLRMLREYLQAPPAPKDATGGSWQELYTEAERWLEAENRGKEVSFLS